MLGGWGSEVNPSEQESFHGSWSVGIAENIFTFRVLEMLDKTGITQKSLIDYRHVSVRCGEGGFHVLLRLYHILLNSSSF